MHETENAKFNFNGYVLTMDWNGKVDAAGQGDVDYTLTSPSGDVIYKVEGDYSVPYSPDGCVDIFAAVALMGFLTGRKAGKSYTPAQLAFIETEGEALKAELFHIDEELGEADFDERAIDRITGRYIVRG